MSRAGRIVRVDPAAAIPGGEILIEVAGFDTSRPGECDALVGGERARLVGMSPRRVLALVPEDIEGGEVEVVLASGDGRSDPARLLTGALLAEDLHPVANPAFDPDDGSLYVTRSGSRGQHLPVTTFRIDRDRMLSEFSGDITNPSGIAFDNTGQMYVTSRLDGTVYRLSSFGEPVAFAKDLGVATGLAFDRAGNLYVGDRTGTIHRVNAVGESTEWAQLDASVSAYHLAFGPDGALYVAGPTVSSYDSVMRVDPSGEASVFFRGLGRPQGLAFDAAGNLYVAASYRGRRGVVRIPPDGARAEMAVAGMNVVGLAFGPAGEMAVATNDAVYQLPLGVRGALVS